MAASWNDLIKLPTKDEIVDKFVGLLRLGGFPVASWHSGSFQKHTVEDESSILVDLATLIQKVAKAGFIKYAAEIGDEWVDLCAENVFAETRKPAIFTQGTAVLTDTAGLGPTTINPGTFWIANEDKSLRFFNVTGGPIPLNGSLPLTFQAETAGTNWNVASGALTQILTPLPGVTVANAALPATGTWITQQGADLESNELLVQRCLDKWSTLGSGSDEGAYRYRATSVSSEITRALVYSPGGGAVRVVVAGDAGPVSSTALALAAALIEKKRPLGVPDVVTSNAIPRAQAVVAHLSGVADPSVAIASAQAAIQALQRRTKIGARVSREKVIAALMSVEAEDLEMTQPAADFQLLLGEVWVPTFSITAS